MIQAIEGHARSKKTWDPGSPVDMGIGAVNKGRGQPTGKRKGIGKGKSREPKNNENSKSDRVCFVCCKTGQLAKDCDHRVRTVNEVAKTAPVSIPVSAITEPGHSLSHVYNRNTPVRHDWILSLTVDIPSVFSLHGKLHETHGTAIHVLSQLVRFSLLSASAKQLPLKSVGGDVLHHLGSKIDSYVYRSLIFQVNCEVAPVARPILSVDMLASKGVLVEFGVEGISSFIQLPDGHKNSHDQRNRSTGVRRDVG